MKRIIKKILLKIAPYFAYIVINVLRLTIRFKVLNPEKISEMHKNGEKIIMAFWHSRLLMLPGVYKGDGISILISEHEDGQVIASTVEFLGFTTTRGSTTRGGTRALREMVRTMKSGSDIAITPDGPRGPRFVAKNGAVVLAKMTGAPVCPVTYNVSCRKQFGSWDGFILPHMFTKGVFIWGDPIYVDRDADRDELEKKRLEVEDELKRITEEADSYF